MNTERKKLIEFNPLFKLTKWVSETTSDLSPIINVLDPSSSVDLESGDVRNDQILTDNQPAVSYEDENNPLGLEDEIDIPSNNDSANEQNVTLPVKRKVYFYLFYSSFVSLFVVLVLVTACTYPLKPDYYIDFQLPAFDKESVNTTEEMKQTVNLNLTLNHRNTLASALYDDINITMFYLPSLDTSVYFASTIAPGFYQHKMKPMEVKVNMIASGLPDLLQEELKSMSFRVNLDFTVRFNCRFLCKHKHHFLMGVDIEY